MIAKGLAPFLGTKAFAIMNLLVAEGDVPRWVRLYIRI